MVTAIITYRHGQDNVVKFDSSFSTPPVTVVTGLSGPADIFYNLLTDTLAIPNSGNNTVTFHGFGTVNIIEEEQLQFSLFPSPCRNQIGIYSEQEFLDGIIRIADMKGRIVKTLKCADLKKNMIDVSDLSPAQYTFNLTSGTTSIQRHFIKVSQ
jgi:hypothetical protein